MRMRPINGMGAVRLGVEGRKSPINSNTARSEKVTTVIVDAMKANGEPLRLIQPRCAAHATTGGVNARKPAAKPMAKANAKTEFTSKNQKFKSAFSPEGNGDGG